MDRPISDLMSQFKAFLNTDAAYREASAESTLNPKPNILTRDLNFEEKFFENTYVDSLAGVGEIGDYDPYEFNQTLYGYGARISFPKGQGNCRISVRGALGGYQTLSIMDTQPGLRTEVTLISNKYDPRNPLSSPVQRGEIFYRKITTGEEDEIHITRHKNSQAAIDATWEFFQEFTAPTQPDQTKAEIPQS